MARCKLFFTVFAALCLVLTGVGAGAQVAVAGRTGFSADMPGRWYHVNPYGYVWKPDVLEAEWAPWDLAPWFDGGWIFVVGLGYVWCPVLPPTSVSPLGWGYDSWYGGWYGFLPNGEFAGASTASYGFTVPYVPPHRPGKPRGAVIRPGAAPVVTVHLIKPMAPVKEKDADRGRWGSSRRGADPRSTLGAPLFPPTGAVSSGQSTPSGSPRQSAGKAKKQR